MKMLRLIGMALFAVLMCTNFASCSSSDDVPDIDEEIGNIKKKLVRLEEDGTNYSNKGVYEFSYDNDGKLVQVTDNGVKYYYNWIDDKINISVRGNTSICDLSNNLITKIVFKDGHYIYNFSHNQSKELTEYTILNYNTQDNKSLYKWEDNNIVTCTSTSFGTTSIEYSNKKNKGWWYPKCDYIGMSYYMDEEALLFVAHPNLLGKQCSYLPKRIENNEDYDYDFIFDLDKEGYVERCTVVKENGHTVVYTYKWQ